MRRSEIGWLLLLLALGSRKQTGTRAAPWSPMGPFPEDNTIPQAPLPPNPLEPRK